MPVISIFSGSPDIQRQAEELILNLAEASRILSGRAVAIPSPAFSTAQTGPHAGGTD